MGSADISVQLPSSYGTSRETSPSTPRASILAFTLAIAEGEYMLDGGVVAITGFLYQLISSGAQLLSVPEENAILALETSGEDAAITGSTQRKIFQFKYSSVGSEINPGTLADILATLKANTTSEPDRQWVLVTNRKLSVISAKLVGPNAADLGDAPEGSKENWKTIRLLAPRLHIKHQSFDGATEAFVDVGRQYGLSQREIEDGAVAVVGAFLKRIGDVGSASAFTVAEVIDKFVGIRQSKPLNASRRYIDLAAQIGRLHSDVVNPDDVFPRQSLERLCDGPELVVVTGHGGMGKTTAVLRAVQDHLLRRQAMGFALISESPQTVEDTIARWRSGHDLVPPETLEMSLTRLGVANSNATAPYLFIILDGYDETGWAEGARRGTLVRLTEHIKHSNRYRSGEPPPKIIVTCRNKADVRFDQFSGVDSDQLAPVKQLHVSEFDDEEFTQVWRDWFPTIPNPTHNGIRTVDEAIKPEPQADANGSFFGLLRSPVFLRCLRKMTLAEPSSAAALLRGDDAQQKELLKLYFKWFTKKVMIRSGLDEDRIAHALHCVACAAEARGSHGLPVWRDACCSDGWLSPAEAIKLFNDAVTCGLVDTTQGERTHLQVRHSMSDKWLWRSAIVRNFLYAV